MGSGLVEQDLCTAQCQTKCNWITSVVSAMLEMFICVESNSQGCCWAVGTWLTSKLQERKERYWVDACRVRLDKKLRQWLNTYMPHVDQGLELLPAGLSRLPESFQDKFENCGYFLFKPKWLLNFQRAAWKTASPGCSKVGPHVTEEGLSDKLPAHILEEDLGFPSCPLLSVVHVRSGEKVLVLPMMVFGLRCECEDVTRP